MQEKKAKDWKRVGFNVEPELHAAWTERVAQGFKYGDYASGSELTREFWSFYVKSGMSPTELKCFFHDELRRRDGNAN